MKIIVGLFFVFVFAVSVIAQNAASPQSLNSQISDLEKQISEKNNERGKLLQRYSSEYPDVKTVDSSIIKLKQKLSALYLTKKAVLDKKFADELPNNDVILLKMIVIQNKQILEILTDILRSKQID